MNCHRCLVLRVSILILCATIIAPIGALEVDSAPFDFEFALRNFSNFLINLISNADLLSAESLARDNSHLDDEITQQNLVEVFALLKRHGVDREPMEAHFIQESKFGRSFIRHQYSLDNTARSIRCMLTYRRKTDGWRLNQLWCS